MSSLLRSSRHLALAAGLAASTLALGSSPTQAAVPPPLPTAAVAVGDSFISGEGAGNYASVVDSNGIPQGYQDFSAPNSNAYFCHRSNSAQIEVAALSDISSRFNIACSGAIPEDIGTASITRDKGRYVAAQIEQLRAIATTHDIDLVVVSLGANSVGFGDVAAKCVGKFLTDAFTGWWEGWINIWSPHATTTGACGRGDFPGNAELAQAEADVLASSRLILDTLAEIDSDGQHRVVFQDYVNPLPLDFAPRFHDERRRRDTRDKFRSLARERYAAGCPVHRGTLPYAHELSAGLGTMVGNVHSQLRTDYPGADLVYLNVQHAFDGARLCETDSSPNGALHTPTRAVTSRDGRVQNTLDGNKFDVRKLFKNCTDYFQRCQEIWHPNAGGHAVLGQCLAAAWTASTPLVDCARQSDGRIVATQKAPSIDVEVFGLVRGGRDRSGEQVLHVSGGYSTTLRNASGLTVVSVSVTGRSANTGPLATQTSMSGMFRYTAPCSSGSVGLSVTVAATLSDGSTLTDTASFDIPVTDCDGRGVPIR